MPMPVDMVSNNLDYLAWRSVEKCASKTPNLARLCAFPIALKTVVQKSLWVPVKAIEGAVYFIKPGKLPEGQTRSWLALKTVGFTVFTPFAPIVAVIKAVGIFFKTFGFPLQTACFQKVSSVIELFRDEKYPRNLSENQERFEELRQQAPQSIIDYEFKLFEESKPNGIPFGLDRKGIEEALETIIEIKMRKIRVLIDICEVKYHQIPNVGRAIHERIRKNGNRAEGQDALMLMKNNGAFIESDFPEYKQIRDLEKAYTKAENQIIRADFSNQTAWSTKVNEAIAAFKNQDFLAVS